MGKNNPAIIEAINLSYQIKSLTLLDSVSLQIPAGERIAIVGANGAGKTTLIRCLLGLLTTESGQLKLKGSDLTSYSRIDIAKLISYVPQQLPENIHFTVTEFITMSRYAYHIGHRPTASSEDEIALEIINELNISHLKDKPVSSLSGGEKQKVNIAAALTKQTPIIVLDEPSSHLDPKQRDFIQKLIHQMSRETTIITITHDLNWATMCFDRILGMLDSKLVIDTPAAEFTTSENLQIIFGTSWEIYPHPETGRPMILPTF